MNKKFWSFKNLSDKVGELTIYGIISSDSWWGDEITPKQFKKDLDDLGDISDLNIYINSAGGDVFAGQAIHSIIKRHNAKVKVYIDGLAASIASVIAMAGDEVIMPKNAMMMIHNPWGGMIGFADDFRKMADLLDKIKEPIINAYKEKSNLDDDKISQLMDAETWMTADEAKEMGFIDTIEEEKNIAACITDNFKNYKNIPDKFKKIENKENELITNLQNEIEKLKIENINNALNSKIRDKKNKFRELI